MFVTFEGPEGAGKSTVLKKVAERLRTEGFDVLETREPGETSVGAKIREILLHGDAVDPRAELFLFLADRVQHVLKVVRPALNAGRVVLCDRYSDSTVVYQGYGRGLEVGALRDWNRFATDGLLPDLTLLLDLDPQVGLSRLKTKDRLDSQPMEFHARVRDGFLEEARLEPDRWRILDASRSVGDVADEAFLLISNGLRSRTAP